MDILIKQNSKETIYEQIVFQIKMQIANGDLEIGDSLPSIRKLSQLLQISIISVQRAYDELQKEGIIESVPGKGCFISAKFDKSFLKDDLFRQVEEIARKVVDVSKHNGISLDELVNLIKVIWE